MGANLLSYYFAMLLRTQRTIMIHLVLLQVKKGAPAFTALGKGSTPVGRVRVRY